VTYPNCNLSKENGSDGFPSSLASVSRRINRLFLALLGSSNSLVFSTHTPYTHQHTYTHIYILYTLLQLPPLYCGYIKREDYVSKPPYTALFSSIILFHFYPLKNHTTSAKQYSTTSLYSLFSLLIASNNNNNTQKGKNDFLT
jgi:hypothetical protein